MGDRASISFRNGGDESIALFNHWGGAELFGMADSYARALCEEILSDDVTAGIGFASWPLGRLEPDTVMVDFMRWLVQKNEIHIETRVKSSWYFGKDQNDGDNSDNGHYTVDLGVLYADLRAAKERAAMALATATPTPTTKKPKKTAAEWKAAKEMAAKLTGYGSGSPIWGKTDVTVFTEISGYLRDAKDGTGIYHLPLESAIALIDELGKREAYKRLTATL